MCHASAVKMIRSLRVQCLIWGTTVSQAPCRISLAGCPSTRCKLQPSFYPIIAVFAFFHAEPSSPKGIELLYSELQLLELLWRRSGSGQFEKALPVLAPTVARRFQVGSAPCSFKRQALDHHFQIHVYKPMATEGLDLQKRTRLDLNAPTPLVLGITISGKILFVQDSQLQQPERYFAGISGQCCQHDHLVSTFLTHTSKQQNSPCTT